MACGYRVTRGSLPVSWGGGGCAAARTGGGDECFLVTLLLCAAAAVDGVGAAVPTLVVEYLQ